MRRTLSCIVLSAGLAFAQPVSIATPAQWRKLSLHARTPAEHEALADYCKRQASTYRDKQKSVQQELDEHQTLTVNARHQKYPTRAQTLRHLLGHYQDQEKYWSGLANEHEAKAKALASK